MQGETGVDDQFRRATRPPPRGRALCTAVLGLTVLCGACRRSPPPPAQSVEIALSTPYAPGHYRLVEETLPRVRVRLAHIVFTHSSVNESAAGSLWLPSHSSQRTRAQAAALAREASAALAGRAEDFAEYAHKHSDDRSSAQLGGTLGILPGDAIPPAILDALAALKVGEISRPIETEVGFHLVRRLPLPPEQLLGAERIVVAWKGGDTLMRVGRVVERSRAEAAELAQQIAARARAAPETFVQLVRRHSDHHDALRDGSYGAYSSYRPQTNWTELELLSGMREGEVSPVLDSPDGFVIFRRTAAAKAPLLAMTELLLLPPDTAAAGVGEVTVQTRDEGRALAAQLLATLYKEPDRFEELQHKYCCAGRRHEFALGRELAGLGAELEKLAPGQVATKVVETPVGFHIVRRELTQGEAEPEPLLLELPAPVVLDVAEKVRTVRGRLLARYVRDLALPVINGFALGANEANRVAQVFEQLGRAFVEADLDARRRVDAYASAHLELRRVLGDERARQVRDIEATWLTALLLAPRRPTQAPQSQTALRL